MSFRHVRCMVVLVGDSFGQSACKQIPAVTRRHPPWELSGHNGVFDSGLPGIRIYTGCPGLDRLGRVHMMTHPWKRT